VVLTDQFHTYIFRSIAPVAENQSIDLSLRENTVQQTYISSFGAPFRVSLASTVLYPSSAIAHHLELVTDSKQMLSICGTQVSAMCNKISLKLKGRAEKGEYVT
jgi:hypothetical protein